MSFPPPPAPGQQNNANYFPRMLYREQDSIMLTSLQLRLAAISTVRQLTHCYVQADHDSIPSASLIATSSIDIPTSSTAEQSILSSTTDGKLSSPVRTSNTDLVPSTPTSITANTTANSTEADQLQLWFSTAVRSSNENNVRYGSPKARLVWNERASQTRFVQCHGSRLHESSTPTARSSTVPIQFGRHPGREAGKVQIRCKARPEVEQAWICGHYRVVQYEPECP